MAKFLELISVSILQVINSKNLFNELYGRYKQNAVQGLEELGIAWN